MAFADITYQRDPVTGQVLFDANGFPLQASGQTANTYADLQARIADEVLGSPTTAQIQNAIQDAISTFERGSFDFNRIRSFGGVTGSLSDLQTVLGKEFYGNGDLPVLVNFPHISKILILAFNNRDPLNERTTSWIDDASVSTSWNGLPTDWAWDSGALRLYPVPDGAYPIIIDATIRFAPLVNPTDFNPWTNRAEALIRFEAKRLLFLNITRDADQAMAMEREILGDPMRGKIGQLAILKAETMRRSGGPGRLRASRGYF